MKTVVDVLVGAMGNVRVKLCREGSNSGSRGSLLPCNECIYCCRVQVENISAGVAAGLPRATMDCEGNNSRTGSSNHPGTQLEVLNDTVGTCLWQRNSCAVAFAGVMRMVAGVAMGLILTPSCHFYELQCG